MRWDIKSPSRYTLKGMPPKGSEYHVTRCTFYWRELGMEIALSFRLLIPPCGVVWPVMSRSSSNSQSKYVAVTSSHTSAYSNLFVFVSSNPKCRDSDCLRDLWSRDSIPVGARFSASVQTGTGAQPASFTMRTGSFPGLKRPGLDVAYPHLEQRLKKEHVTGWNLHLL